MKTIKEVRQEILKEYKIDQTADVIRRDQGMGIFDVPRDKENNYRMFSDTDIKKVKYIALLRDLGIPKRKIKEVIDGNTQMVWDRINQLLNIDIPALKNIVGG